MCVAGGAQDKDQAAAQLAAERRGNYAGLRAQASAQWDTLSADQQARYGGDKQRFVDEFTTYRSGIDEKAGKAWLGDDYIDPTTGRKAGAPPLAPDLTDDLLQKTRTSFALRLQTGKNRASSFNGTQMGGLDLSKPVLGGY